MTKNKFGVHDDFKKHSNANFSHFHVNIVCHKKKKTRKPAMQITELYMNACIQTELNLLTNRYEKQLSFFAQKRKSWLHTCIITITFSQIVIIAISITNFEIFENFNIK